MRLAQNLLTVFVATAILGACGPASEADSEAAPGAESATESSMSEAELAHQLDCWLRDATLEEAMERTSPLGEVAIDLGGHRAKICYGRPSARERVVEGGLIPFGEPWRLGANEATAIHLPFPAIVGGVELQAGSYSLYTIAGEFEWEFVLNSNAERWGVPINDAVRASDLASFTGLPRKLTEPVEQFTIGWHTHGGENGHLVLEWGTTRVEIEVSMPDHVH